MSEEQKQTLIERVKKLLRLSRGTNSEAESLNALAKAKELCALNGIKFETLDAEMPQIKEVKVLNDKRHSKSKMWIYGILDKHFGIMVCMYSNGVYFVGPEENIEIGKFILKYLLDCERRAWDEYVTEYEKKFESELNTELPKGMMRKAIRKYKKDFIDGFYYKVFNRLCEQPLRNDKVKAAVKRHLEEKFGDLNYRKPTKSDREDKSGTFLRGGIAAGSKISLTRPVDGKSAESAMLCEGLRSPLTNG